MTEGGAGEPEPEGREVRARVMLLRRCRYPDCEQSSGRCVGGSVCGEVLQEGEHQSPKWGPWTEFGNLMGVVQLIQQF